jgi:hypothetical protein
MILIASCFVPDTHKSIPFWASQFRLPCYFVNNDIEGKKMATSDQIVEVIKLIEDSPAWTDIQFGDRSEEAKKLQQRIVEQMSKVSTYEVHVIRKAIVRYIRNDKNPKFNLPRLSRVFILNRYIFNIPATRQIKHPVFGAWNLHPTNGEEINQMWPLAFDNTGSIILVGKCSGYSGPPYKAIQEFDFFYKAFGLRKPSTNHR